MVENKVRAGGASLSPQFVGISLMGSECEPISEIPPEGRRGSSSSTVTRQIISDAVVVREVNL